MSHNLFHKLFTKLAEKRLQAQRASVGSQLGGNLFDLEISRTRVQVQGQAREGRIDD